MKCSKAMRIFGYSASKLAAIPILLRPLYDFMNCIEHDISFWDILSFADYAACDNGGSACTSEIDAKAFFGIVCLILMEMAYVWLMYMELSPRPIKKPRNRDNGTGVHVEWIERDSSTSGDIEINL